ncbi:tail fiber protein [uncultured Sphingomonas sp.]|uniref:phage tail protein n=1 Tax=uncultured Sphingomonas sp. TaxID=158754 RepID=UPI0025E41B80|nr:tail fiber protein [uncultured Sphingomonas sp.]
MTEPFVGEVQIFAFDFAPAQWALANGALVNISQAGMLFALYSNQFGGDGQRTFGLPNLASRHACGAGQSPGNSPRYLGETLGAPDVSLTIGQVPAHTHPLYAYTTESEEHLVATPSAAVALGNSLGNLTPYAAIGQSRAQMNARGLGLSGNGAAHENRQPFLGLTYAVAINGTFPFP